MEISPAGAINGFGTDTKGKYTLSGTVALGGQVNIIKKRMVAQVQGQPRPPGQMNQLGGFAPADPNNIIEYNGTFEAGKIAGMWMIGEHMGEFEVELLSQKFTGATNFFPIN